ncbi:hypothetical protein LUZ62_054330 [Rhynchospora pubera]|uniref:Uncharacterized protein n=1 Tax=Rhynchospora pubera TaxID=906938 RepID=A0AAV8DUY4_9POAL|nr:hypothetical protein LUZ62_054328 [Rhynchospora pubera]KAJ4770072.1 hypothetical protein LUZ62_054329 [Rhynchospora pubera]KAJ4770073.1 hypothetical protein LUZ62_054330 [Rhynchospora pubera]
MDVVSVIEQNLSKRREKSKADEKFTIFRVPAHIRQTNKHLYEPRMVSIGPYYHGSASFQAMENHKWRYLEDYLSRNTGNSIRECIFELKKLESLARNCYFEGVDLKSDEFLLMMLLDGCFIIELLIKWNHGFSDVIFDVGWVLPIIRNDLLLLENQIPFFVIEKLFSLLGDPVAAGDEKITLRIAPLIQMLLAYLSEGRQTARPVFKVGEIEHILHVYHHCYVPDRSGNSLSTNSINVKHYLNPKNCFKGRPQSSNRRAPRTIPCATELQEAGITFKRRKTTNILDIKFREGTLEIPFISIEDTRRTRLLNLVSFEQCYSKLNNDLTSYACFMGALFKTTRDVKLLQEKGIIDNLLATNEELVSFFNWLTENSYLDYEEHYLKDLFINVNRYFNSNCHKWRATLKRDYFSNPWSFISVIAAFALLVLSFLQTLYTILSYKNQKN